MGETAGGTAPAWAAVADLARGLVAAAGCWGPTLTEDGGRLAFVSDRGGRPQVWAGEVGGEPRPLPLSDDPVLAVRWSPDGEWLAASVASGGGVRAEVWVLRPDGSHARRVAGGDHHAVLGPWARRGHRLAVTRCGIDPAGANRSVLIDPDGDARRVGTVEPVASGPLLQILGFSGDGRFALLRDGARGAQRCWVLDRRTGDRQPLLPYPDTGSTEAGMLRPSPRGDPAAMVALLITDAGQARPALVGVALDRNGRPGPAGTLAGRDDADLELVDADTAGRRVLLGWDVDGRSELEVLDTTTGERHHYRDMPGDVVAGGVLARDGSCAVLSIEGPRHPGRLWRLDLADGRWQALTPVTVDGSRLVVPTLEHLESHDGLALSGWLYRPPPDTGGPGAQRVPALLSLHGGPEAQERPVFNPQHQVLAAAGIAVFAPNIRGSSGFGRSFVHADDRYGRLEAIDDIAACAEHLADTGVADPERIAVSGRSYGGYATLMALTHHPWLYAAGVDICGMSDLRTFYRDTEPWIARAAVTKYGDPDSDAGLLARLSPLRYSDDILVPLLVVHGELDTNVPVSEGRQLVAALRALDRDVEYLLLEGEGHEYRRASSRLLLLEMITRFLDRTLAVSAHSSGRAWLGGPRPG